MLFLVPLLLVFSEFELTIAALRHFGFMPFLLWSLMMMLAGKELIAFAGKGAAGSWAGMIARRAPPPEKLSRLLLVIAGIMLAVPGLVSDLTALLLLLSPLRKGLARRIHASLLRKGWSSAGSEEEAVEYEVL